jgi:hypothetical protein
LLLLSQAQPAQRRTPALIPFFSPSLEDWLGEPNSGWRRGPQFFQHLVELVLDLVQGRAGRPKNNGVLEE